MIKFSTPRMLFSAAVMFSTVFLAVAEEELQPVAEVRIPSLMKASQSLSQLFESTKPGSSGIIAVGVAALSFSPQLAPFDLAEPIHLLGYPSVKDGKPSFEWGILLVKRPEADLKNGIKGKSKEPIFFKDMGDSVFMTFSKKLSESVGNLSVPEYKDPDFHIEVIFNPEKYFSSFPGGLDSFRKEVLRQVISKKGREEEDFNELKFTSMRIGAFEDFLRQCKRFDMKFLFCPDNISIRSEFDPIPGSKAEKFLEKQKSGGKSSRPDEPSYELESEGHILIEKGLKDSIVSIARETLAETSDGTCNDVIDLVSMLTENFSGSFKFRMESFDTGAPICLHVDADKAKRKEMLDFLEKRKDRFLDDEGLFRYKKDGKESKFNFFISVNDQGINTLYGKMDAKYANNLLSSGRSGPGGKEEDADIRVDAYSKPDKMAPLFSSFVIFGGRKLLVNSYVYPEGVRRIVPPELLQDRREPQQD